jgi:predicted nucleotidyltransferase
MEQKDYKLGIIIELLKNPCHVRGMAKTLGTNHMSISRRIKELFMENVVDYKEEGKNKVYFLKKNAEAKSYAFMAENYKIAKILKKYPELRRIVEIIQHARIRLAVLFGSYAKGIAKPESDIDVYMETMSNELKKNIERINAKLSVKIGRYDKSSLLIKEIEKNHVILKGIEEYYEKNKFFE